MKTPQYLSYAALALGATALAGPAFAQTPTEPSAYESSASTVFEVFFPLDSAELDADARAEITQAGDEWEQAESGLITVIGHSDTSGSAGYNLELSKRRAQAVEEALLAEGIPLDQIGTAARGEEDLSMPTSDGVREGQNRRVEIVIPEVQEETAVVVPSPQPVPPAPEPEPKSEPKPDLFTFALGPVWGKNFGENDNGAENDMVGAELTFRALPGFLGGVSISQMGLWAFNAIDDGLTGRTVASIDFAPDFGVFRPTLALNGGLVYGEGVQDGFVVGPEIRFDVVPIAGFNIGLKVAYDYQFESGDFDEGIVWTGMDLGLRF